MSSAEGAEPIDPILLRNALGKFATGITVVTAKNSQGGYVGTTASSFNSVSLDPALVLWSIDNRSRSLDAYLQGQDFVVNVLAADQVSISNHFARQQEDKFQGMEFDLNAEGVPVLPGCSAVFECRLYATYEGGDHTIIVGEVVRFRANERNTLLFHQGAYAVSEYHPAAEDRVAIPANEKELPFAENYLPYLLRRCFLQLKKKVADMIEQQGLSEHKYRILASLLGVEQRTHQELEHFSVLEEAVLAEELASLQAAGLVLIGHDGVALTDSGKAKIEPLVALAKASEADALGSFNVEEALLFKRYLRKMLEWME